MPLIFVNSLSRIFLRRLVEETFLLEFLKKTEIDKLFRLGILRLRHLGRQRVQEELEPLHGWIGFLGRRFHVHLIRLFEHFGSSVRMYLANTF